MAFASRHFRPAILTGKLEDRIQKLWKLLWIQVSFSAPSGETHAGKFDDVWVIRTKAQVVLQACERVRPGSLTGLRAKIPKS